MSVLSQPYMHDEGTAFAHVEAMLWPAGPVCPHCGCMGRTYELKGVRTKASKKNPEGVERFGLKKCGDCRKQFTVRHGTIFEESHIPLHKWLQAIFLLTSSKKGISSNQLHRTLGLTLKSAWFLSHRIREAMRSGEFNPFGSNGGIVEADETFISNDPERPKKKGARSYHHKLKVLSLIDRETGKAHSVVVDDLTAESVVPVLRDNIAREARLMTDEHRIYVVPGRTMFADHQTVEHGKGEYVRGDVHTNTLEGFFSIFKRGMKGVYQHCGKRHLHRYMAEFDFRYNNRKALGVEDQQRASRVLINVKGKRLLYRDSLGA